MSLRVTNTTPKNPADKFSYQLSLFNQSTRTRSQVQSKQKIGVKSALAAFHCFRLQFQGKFEIIWQNKLIITSPTKNTLSAIHHFDFFCTRNGTRMEMSWIIKYPPISTLRWKFGRRQTFKILRHLCRLPSWCFHANRRCKAPPSISPGSLLEGYRLGNDWQVFHTSHDRCRRLLRFSSLVFRHWSSWHDLLFRFYDTDVIWERLLGSRFTSWVPWEHDLDFDTKYTWQRKRPLMKTPGWFCVQSRWTATTWLATCAVKREPSWMVRIPCYACAH